MSAIYTRNEGDLDNDCPTRMDLEWQAAHVREYEPKEQDRSEESLHLLDGRRGCEGAIGDVKAIVIEQTPF